jgi:predicted phage terminase large subunit-like protein
MTQSPTRMYKHLLRHDLCALNHRAFLELYPGVPYLSNWHIELIASKLEDVRTGRCKRLIVNVGPRHFKSFLISVVFPAWLLGHDPTKQIMSVTYSQDLSDNLARRSRSLMMSPFYQALFDTRVAPDREAAADFETTAGGNRFATSLAGVVTGRGADVIIIDDPLKADDALSDKRRRAVNARYDDTLRTRVNNQTTGAIIMTMQRLHTEDPVAHVQQQEPWEVVSLPAIAEHDEICGFRTSYGYRRIVRRQGDILHPDLLSREALEAQRRGMTDYNFAGQYQQNPQSPAGNFVKRDWLKFYSPEDKPDKFDQVLQAWDTANKETELADYSVCTTWGIKGKHLFLLDLFRDKLEFPALKRKIEALAKLHGASIVLIEDKASGTSLIQELRATGLSQVQAAPSLDGDKIMRLRVQTAKIEGGFVHFPQQAPWLDAYLSELVTFPNAKNDDQVDSTVFALAWSTSRPVSGTYEYYRREAAKVQSGTSGQSKLIRVLIPPGAGHHQLYPTGRMVRIPKDRIIEVTEEEAEGLLRNGGKRVD